MNKKPTKINAERIRFPNGKIQYVDEKRYGGNGFKAFWLANCKCEYCGAEKNLLIHHNNGYSNNIEDLFILCKKCHGQAEHKNIILKHNREVKE